ncbi:acyl-CoA dehydrogenase [Algoriphagus litoralis]|uniref:acyl-CoA dehydrogenase n=1 Tax=Algoriphagus litoralis TaxID=2202829 RepID=UPI001E5C85B4|nr:acyl-CoA dehydrogenase [Algoriphagus litoralis]
MITSDLVNSHWAPQAEKQGCLTPEMLDFIYRENSFKLFVPKELDGLGLTLPEALEVEERLAELDASMGWTVTLCAGAAWFVGFLDEKLSQEIFADPKVCLAGSGFVGGKANRVGDHYEISGSWTYASGALHATYFTANCELLEEGKQVLDLQGKPLVKAFILHKEEVEILDGWSYMGMIATGSHAFKAENLMVPLDRAFEIIPEKVSRDEPLYRYPFLQFAEATLAVNILGITQHLQNLISATFWKRHEFRTYDPKQLDYFRKLASSCENKLQTGRGQFYQAIAKSWDELETKGKITATTLKSVSRSSRKLTGICREINARMHPFAGLEAAKTHTELNRVWRDFNTVSQHALLTFPF